MKSLQSRIVAIVLIGSIVPIFSIWMLYVLIERPKLKQAQRDSRLEIVTQIGNIVQKHISKSFDDMRNLSSSPLLIAPTSKEARTVELERLRNLLSAEISILDDNGFVIDSSYTTALAVQEYSPAFKRALSTQAITVSEPYRSDKTGNLYLASYIPVVMNDTSSKVIKVVARLDPDTQTLDSVKVPEGGDLILLDADARTLYSYRSGPLFEKFSNRSIIQSLTASRTGVYRNRNDGLDYYFACKVVDPFGKAIENREWSLISMVPVSVANATINEINQIFISVLIIGGLASILLCIALTRKTLRPLDTLAICASRAAGGDFNGHVEPTGTNEMDLVGQAFNTMLDKIALQRETLETEVKDRTSDLAKTLATCSLSYEAMYDGLLIVDNHGHITETNSAFRKLFELPDIPKGSVATISENFNAWLDESSISRKHLTGEDHRSPQVIKEEWHQIAAPNHTLQVYSAPIWDAEVMIGRIWIFKDLTDIRTLEEELRQSQKMEAIGTLAGGVAHDFNNLLTAIKGNLEICSAPDSSPRVNQRIQSALKATERATGLVRQLLTFSRKSDLDIQACDLVDIATETKELLTRTVDPSISIQIHTEGRIPTIDGDPNQLQQIVMNLCVNAKDAVNKNGIITIWIGTVKRSKPVPGIDNSEPTDHVVLEVTDNGSGMPLAVQKQIFDPFFTTKEQGKGTGLGLSTCYSIATQHNGWMECDSSPDEGTTMRLILPPGSVTKAEDSETFTTDAAQNFSAGEYTVLISDDEPAVRGVAEIILKRKGFNIMTADDGEEAVRIVRENDGEIDLVLMDLTMPKMDGREAFTEISHHFPSIPVMICSGYLCEFNDFKTEDGHAPAGFVNKPYDLTEIVSQVTNTIQEHPRIPSLN